MNSQPELSTTAVILQYSGETLYVVLSRSAGESGLWELPTSPIFESKTSIASLTQTLEGVVGFRDKDISYREQLYTTESVINQHTSVCIAYLYLSRGMGWHKGERKSGIFPVDSLPPLRAEDRSVIHYALDRLHAKALYSNIVGFLLPAAFDLTELQQAFETITKQPVDKRNFRKKILSLDIISAISEKSSEDSTPAHAVRYALNSSTLSLLETPFRTTSPSVNNKKSVAKNMKKTPAKK